MSTKPDSKEVSVAKRQHKALMQSMYKALSEHGLSPQARRYRDEYIRPKKKETEKDNEEVISKRSFRNVWNGRTYQTV